MVKICLKEEDIRKIIDKWVIITIIIKWIKITNSKTKICINKDNNKTWIINKETTTNKWCTTQTKIIIKIKCLNKKINITKTNFTTKDNKTKENSTTITITITIWECTINKTKTNKLVYKIWCKIYYKIVKINKEVDKFKNILSQLILVKNKIFSIKYNLKLWILLKINLEIMLFKNS